MLTSKDRSRLRAQGHHLRPELWVGKEGISEGTLTTLGNSFNTKELVKIKLQESCPLDRKEAAALLADGIGADVVHILGNTILLYRPMPEET